MATTPTPRSTNSRETLYAIIASAVIALVLATLLTGNPFHALRMGYIDYSHTPADGAPAASTTRAPADQTQK